MLHSVLLVIMFGIYAVHNLFALYCAITEVSPYCYSDRYCFHCMCLPSLINITEVSPYCYSDRL